MLNNFWISAEKRKLKQLGQNGKPNGKAIPWHFL